MIDSLRNKLILVSGGNKDDVTLKKVFARFDKSEDG